MSDRVERELIEQQDADTERRLVPLAFAEDGPTGWTVSGLIPAVARWIGKLLRGNGR